jgi:hypothetical protein
MVHIKDAIGVNTDGVVRIRTVRLIRNFKITSDTYDSLFGVEVLDREDNRWRFRLRFAFMGYVLA